jgi:tRNA modification GTPase
LDETLREVRIQIAGKGKKLIILVNKIDADANGRRAEFNGTIDLNENETFLFISAKTGSGIDDLKKILGRMTGGDQLSTEDVIITNIRHYEALTQVSESLERVMQGLGDNIPADLIAIDMRQAIHYLGEITGEITTDEILGNIFKNFCIGK